MSTARSPADCVGQRAIQLVLYGSIRPTRGYLAVIASIWAIGLWLPGHTFDRPVYAYMSLLADENSWATAWTVIAVLLWWRTLGKPSQYWFTFLTDFASLCMFVGVAGAIWLTKMWPFPAAIAADMGAACASLWVLARSWESRGRVD